jgi:hypothetical protein
MVEEHDPEIRNEFGYHEAPQLLIAAESVASGSSAPLTSTAMTGERPSALMAR